MLRRIINIILSIMLIFSVSAYSQADSADKKKDELFRKAKRYFFQKKYEMA